MQMQDDILSMVHKDLLSSGVPVPDAFHDFKSALKSMEGSQALVFPSEGRGYDEAIKILTHYFEDELVGRYEDGIVRQGEDPCGSSWNNFEVVVSLPPELADRVSKLVEVGYTFDELYVQGVMLFDGASAKDQQEFVRKYKRFCYAPIEDEWASLCQRLRIALSTEAFELVEKQRSEAGIPIDAWKSRHRFKFHIVDGQIQVEVIEVSIVEAQGQPTATETTEPRSELEGPFPEGLMAGFFPRNDWQANLDGEELVADALIDNGTAEVELIFSDGVKLTDASVPFDAISAAEVLLKKARGD